jgi:hypothetical protein
MNAGPLRILHAISAAVVAVVIGSSGRATAACSTDLDCKGDRICDGGKCVNPTAPAPAQPTGSRERAIGPCTKKADCKGNRICEHGQCVDALPPTVAKYQSACDSGDMQGCQELGNIYFNGEGVAKDERRAADLYRKACDGNNFRSCAFLGAMYEKGEALRKDDQRAAELFQKACAGGDQSGCYKQQGAAKPAAATPLTGYANPAPVLFPSDAPADDGVPVDFSGPQGYLLRSTNRLGVAVECLSPCTLRLSPGLATVHVVGHFDQTIQVPNHPASATLSLRRTGWAITGAIIGACALIQAVVFYEVGHDSRQWSPLPAVVSVGGFSLMAVMLAVTHSKIVVDDRQAAASPWSRLAFGLQPRPNGGVLMTGMRF